MIDNFYICGGFTNRSSAFAISAAATWPFKWASLPPSSSNVSKIANELGTSWIAYQEIVPGSALTSGMADRRKSATPVPCLALLQAERKARIWS
jgi:hypothetical protein